MEIVKKSVYLYRPPKGKKMWRQEVIVDGQKKQFKSTVSEKKLKYLVDLYVEEVKSKICNKNNITIKDACMKFLMEYPKVKDGTPLRNPKRWAKEKLSRFQRIFFNVVDKEKLLSEITIVDLNLLKRKMKLEGKSAKTINYMIGDIRGVVSYFESIGIEGPNIKEVQWSKLVCKVERKAEELKVVFSDEQEEKILDVIFNYCNDLDDDFYLYNQVKLAMMTGQRKQNVIHLKWSQVDFKNNVLIYGTREIKTGKHFEFDIPKKAKNLLEALYKQKGKSEYVFTNKRGRHAGDPKKRFQNCRVILEEKFNIVFPKFYLWKCFRSSLVTQSAIAGFQDNEQLAIGDWSDPKVVKNHYKTYQVVRIANKLDKMNEVKKYL